MGFIDGSKIRLSSDDNDDDDRVESGNFRKFPPENVRKYIPIFPEISGNYYFRKISENFY